MVVLVVSLSSKYAIWLVPRYIAPKILRGLQGSLLNVIKDPCSEFKPLDMVVLVVSLSSKYAIWLVHRYIAPKILRGLQGSLLNVIKDPCSDSMPSPSTWWFWLFPCLPNMPSEGTEGILIECDKGPMFRFKAPWHGDFGCFLVFRIYHIKLWSSACLKL